jgi:prevent-host-death family protein
MQVSISHAKAQLTDLVRRAEEGEDIILTRHGHAAVRLTPMNAKPKLTPDEKMRRLEEIRLAAAEKATPGVSAARSADFLYDENGLPG